MSRSSEALWTGTTNQRVVASTMNTRVIISRLRLDDDASVRRGLGSLFRSWAFGSAFSPRRRNPWRGSGPTRRAASSRRAAPGPERAGLPGRTDEGAISDSDHLHHRPWRYPDHRPGDEGRRGRVRRSRFATRICSTPFSLRWTRARSTHESEKPAAQFRAEFETLTAARAGSHGAG